MKYGGRITGGRALAEMLKLSNVGPMFGMGGFQLLPFYEGIRDLGMEHYLINDERCGVFAADAYARMTGRPGICDGTLGPGATNLITGLVESLEAGIPLIAIIGDTHRSHSGKHMTQETKQTEIIRPAVKELIRVEMPERIPELVRRAFSIATSNRPGPVVLDIPEDIAHAEYEYDESDFYVNERTLSIPSFRTRPDLDDLNRASILLSQAKRPLILAGGGVHLSQAYEELLTLAEQNDIPVAHTLSGKGAIACTHDLCVGLFGRFDRIANDLVQTSDCLFAIGCKLGEVATKRYSLFSYPVSLIHLDVDAKEIYRWAPTEIGLWGDIRASLSDLVIQLEGKKVNRSEYLTDIRNRREKWQQEATLQGKNSEKPINMVRLVHELNKIMPEDGVIVADGGFAAHWVGLLYDTKKAGRHFVAARGFASIGYGLPGTIGVQLALSHNGSKAPVVGITGDGGMNMSIGELETALRAKTSFTLIVINNAASGYVKALQHAVFGEGKYQSSTYNDTNYAILAKGFGCNGIRVENPDEIGPALEEALQNREVPTVIDLVVTRDPSKMLPSVDARSLKVKSGDRPI